MKKWNRIKFHPNLPLGADGKRVTASPEHIRLSREAAREGMVLLKNEGGALPLRFGAKVALFGKGTYDYVKGGGGSGDVTVPYVRNLADGMKQFSDRVTLFPETDAFYSTHIHSRYAEGRDPGTVEEPELPDELVRRAAAFADTAVISISRFSSEGWDRKSAFDKIKEHVGVWKDDPKYILTEAMLPKGDYVLSDAEAAMVAKVTAAFDRVVVVLNVGGVFDTSWIKDAPGIDAALMAWQAGLEGGLAEAELLLGLDNPSGKLADTFAASLEDYPSSPGFYASDDYVDYQEDIYVGYRYFETIPGAAEKVNYPFGYGLSYTRFELTAPQFSTDGDVISASLSVTNTGNFPGREVVQLYFSAPQGKLGKPARQLAAWQKTRKLAPGESQRVELAFPVTRMASYDDLGKVQKSAWLLEAGEYHFFVGTDVRAPEADFTWRLPNTRIVEQLTARMVPTQLKKRLLADGSYEALPLGTPNDPNADALERMSDADSSCVHPAVRARRAVRFLIEKPKRQLSEVAEGEITLDEFIAQLSDEDLAWLLGGQPNAGVANTYGYGNLPEFGVPNAMSADGPAGLRIQPEVGVATTAFPCACLLACTWNEALTEAVGRAAGAEVKENNIAAWLAPGVNIHRNPLCGRNFEYYSEDPLLTGHLAGALVRGVQSNGVAATAKHLALNNKETNRKEADSRASERAIREIYLKAFEIIAKDYDVWSIMTSYNVINGHRASENADLLNGILREEWGYEGMVTTDWWTSGEHYKECAAGNDVKMGCGYPERLLAALEKGVLKREQMELAAKHILGMILKLD
ncbi:MAG: glycoside hydrolase family 3 C-terminal domain-containing protein [Clostridia bacterium]|nr:glycoside hydrolase family 3 C-terminal domain-containing protein [Clostridia bacterium]